MKTVLEMAREAGWDDHHAEFDTRIERFAELVRADERNSCMKEADMLRNDFVRFLRPPIVVAVGCFLLAYIVGFK
jgi:hypothetical protein